MSDSIPPARADLEAIDTRINTLERMVRDHREESERRHTQRERDVERQNRLFEQQRGTLETIVDKLSAVILDQESVHKQQNVKDLEWQEEKGALLGQMARDSRLINARFDQLDQNDIAQNTKIAGIEVALSTFKSAGDMIIEDARARNILAKDKAEKEIKRDKLLSRIELYCKVFMALSAVIGFWWVRSH